MTIESNLFKLMSTSEVKTVNDNTDVDFVMNFEVLDGCKHHCPGCFVNRRNNLGEVDLHRALNLAKDLTNSGLRFREIILGPTDIFSAINSSEILKNKDFQKLLKLHYKTRITSTAMFEDTSIENIKEIFKILDNPAYYKSDMILEFLVPMNVEKILNGDENYYQHHMDVLKFFKNNTPKIVDWSFVINVGNHPLLEENFEKVTTIVREKFGGIIEFLPSFFRSGNDERIETHLDQWSKFLRANVTQNNFADIMLTIADKHHNSYNTIVMNWKKNKMYISPFIYEQILSQHPDLEIQEFNINNVFNKNTDLITKQYNYSAKTKECSGCEYLSTCIGRNVLSFMETKNRTECVYPKEILNMYTNIDAKVKYCADEHIYPELKIA